MFAEKREIDMQVSSYQEEKDYLDIEPTEKFRAKKKMPVISFEFLRPAGTAVCVKPHTLLKPV